MHDGRVELARRVVRLDEKYSEVEDHLGPDDPPGVSRVLVEVLRIFVEVLGEHTLDLLDASRRNVVARRRLQSFQITPEVADAEVAHSHALTAIQARAPEIVTGPLRADSQCWISHGAHEGQPGPAVSAQRPQQKHFVPASLAAHDNVVGEKPLHVGLFTSTRVLGDFGMWWTYLHHGVDGGLFARPWAAWSLLPTPDVRILEVTSAAEWAALVCEYGVERDGLLCPNWRSVAAGHDAVHMTVRAVLATQGLNLVTSHGPLVAPYWDVESTLWLNWRFLPHELVRLVERC